MNSQRGKCTTSESEVLLSGGDMKIQYQEGMSCYEFDTCGFIRQKEIKTSDFLTLRLEKRQAA